MALDLNLFGLIRAAILIVATILCIAGTAAQQIVYKVETSGITFKRLFFLYGYKISADGSTAGLVKYESDDCGLKSRLDAAYAFAIISCIVIGFALIAVVLIIVGVLGQFNKYLSLASMGLSAAGVVSTLIAWAIVAGLFHHKCDGASLAQGDGYKLDAGFALLIVTWILMIGDCVVAALNFLGILGKPTAKVVDDVEANAVNVG